MADRKPDEAAVDKLLLSILDAYGRATQRMLPNGPSHLATFSHEVRPILRSAVAAIGSGTQGRDTDLLRRAQRYIQKVHNGSQLELLKEIDGALVSPEKVTAPLDTTLLRLALRAALVLAEEITDLEGREGITDSNFAEQVIALAQDTLLVIRDALAENQPSPTKQAPQDGQG